MNGLLSRASAWLRASSLVTSLRLLTLRPHGSNLLTPGAAFWLLATWSLILVMAVTEAVAWGNLGYYFTDGPARWHIAAATGGIVFVVVYMMDVSLMTVDRAYDDHQEAIYGVKPRSSRWKRLAKNTTGLGLRLFIVVASLTLTAPFLSMLVFSEDIGNLHNGAAISEIEEARSALEARQQQAREEKLQELQGLRSAFQEETAGRGATGLSGLGPAAKAIQINITAVEGELDALKAEQAAELEGFESAAAGWQDEPEQLATRYGVVLPEQSLTANRDALATLSEQPEFQETELAIKAFLAFIFLGLLTLKVREPSSIRLYFSETLQAEHERFQRGEFGDAMPVSTVTPQQLYRFLTEKLPALKAAEEAEQARQESYRIRMEEAQLEAEHERLAAERLEEKRAHELKLARLEYERQNLAQKLREEAEEARLRRERAAADERRAMAQENSVLLAPRLQQAAKRVADARQAERASREAYQKAYTSHQDLLSAIETVEGHIASLIDQLSASPELTANMNLKARLEYEGILSKQIGLAQIQLLDLKHSEPPEKARLAHAERTLREHRKDVDDAIQTQRELEAQHKEASHASLHTLHLVV